MKELEAVIFNMARKYEDRLTPNAWIDMCDIALVDIKKQLIDLKQVKATMPKDEYERKRMRLNIAMAAYRNKQKLMKEKRRNG